MSESVETLVLFCDHNINEHYQNASRLPLFESDGLMNDSYDRLGAGVCWKIESQKTGHDKHRVEKGKAIKGQQAGEKETTRSRCSINF